MDPEEAWPVLAYGAWQVTSGVQTPYRPMANIEELRATAQYRILTPADYAAARKGSGAFAFAMLHPMVGGIPPELAWKHLRLFEQAML